MRRYLYFFFLLVPLTAQAILPEVIKVHTDAIEQFMVTHPDLGTTLKTNPEARSELFTHHRTINRLMLDVVTQNDARQHVFLWYRKHINQYPNYFKHSEIDYNQYPYLPQLRFQIWTNLYESRIDDAKSIKLVTSSRARKRIANALGLHKQNPIRAILIKHRRLFVENDRTTLAQRKNVVRLLSLIPRDLIKAESIRIRDHIGMQIYKDEKLAKRSGVNIFTSVGLAVLAHELNHTINEDVVKLGGSFTLDSRKRFLLASAAGNDVIFYPETYKFNKKATQENFKAKGYWDGSNEHWDRDWLAYWNIGPGKEHNLNWLRQAGPFSKRGIPFFIQAPQEIIAGFANIYFADSEALLQTAISKWHNGYKEPINQFLFFTQLYTMGSKKTRFYKQDPNKYVTMEQVYISRDSNGYINSLKVNDKRYSFTLNEMGQVQSIAIQ